jgi:hypothetical protein
MVAGRIRQRPEHVINGQVCRPRREHNYRTFSVGCPATELPDVPHRSPGNIIARPRVLVFSACPEHGRAGKIIAGPLPLIVRHFPVRGSCQGTSRSSAEAGS